MREDHPAYSNGMQMTDQDIEKGRQEMLTVFAAITAFRKQDPSLAKIVADLTTSQMVAGITVIQLISFIDMMVPAKLLDHYIVETSLAVARVSKDKVREMATDVMKEFRVEE